jgi:hypothetical protein
LEWLLQNGEADGAYVNYHHREEGVSHSLNYSAQHDDLYICRSVYVDEDYGYACLHLYTYSYYTSIDDFANDFSTELLGNISPNKFTSNSPISYTIYNGDDSEKNDFIEFSRIAIGMLLDWLGWTLEQENIGITLADLGFLSWE